MGNRAGGNDNVCYQRILARNIPQLHILGSTAWTGIIVGHSFIGNARYNQKTDSQMVVSARFGGPNLPFSGVKRNLFPSGGHGNRHRHAVAYFHRQRLVGVWKLAA